MGCVIGSNVTYECDGSRQGTRCTNREVFSGEQQEAYRQAAQRGWHTSPRSGDVTCSACRGWTTPEMWIELYPNRRRDNAPRQ